MIKKLLIGFISTLTCIMLFFLISPDQLNANKDKIKTVEVTRDTISLNKDVTGYIKPDISHIIYSKTNSNVKEVMISVNKIITEKKELLTLSSDHIEEKVKNITSQSTLINKQLSKLTLLLEKEKRHKKNIDYQLLLKEKDVLMTKKSILNDNKKELMNLSNQHRIESPISGKVSDIYVHKNAMVKKGTPLLKILSHDKLHIEAYLNENLAPYINHNQKLNFVIDNTNSRSQQAKIITIYPEIIQIKDQRFIKIKLEPQENINDNILIGSKVTISLPIEERKNKLTIPLTALKSENGNYYAMVLNRDKKDKRPLTLGLSDHEKIEIVDGLNEFENVIISAIDE